MATLRISLPLSAVSLAQAALPCVCPLSTALLASSGSPVNLQDLGSAAWKGRGPLLADVLRLHLVHRDDRVEVVGELAQAHLALVGWGPACSWIRAARTCLWVKVLGEPVHARGSPPRGSLHLARKQTVLAVKPSMQVPDKGHGSTMHSHVQLGLQPASHIACPFVWQVSDKAAGTVCPCTQTPARPSTCFTHCLPTLFGRCQRRRRARRRRSGSSPTPRCQGAPLPSGTAHAASSCRWGLGGWAGVVLACVAGHRCPGCVWLDVAECGGRLQGA